MKNLSLVSLALTLCSSPVFAEPEFKVILNKSPLLHGLARRERMKLTPKTRDEKAEKAVRTAIDTGAFDEGILKPDNEETIKQAMGAFLHHQLTENELGVLLLRWQVWSDFAPFTKEKPKTRAVADENGDLTLFGKTLFAKALSERTDPAPWKGFPKGISPFARTVMVVPVPKSVFASSKDKASAGGVISLAPGIFYSRDLGEFVPENHDAVLAPAMEVINAFLTAKNGRYAVKMQPQIKISNVESFLHHMSQGYRPLGLTYPDVWTPAKSTDPISGFLLTPTVFTASDFGRASRYVEPRYLKLLPRFLALIDRTYESRQILNQNPATYALASGRLSVDETKTEWPKDFAGNRADMFAHKIMDLELPSMLSPHPATAGSDLGRTILQDFGSVQSGFSGIIVLDTVVNPKIYRTLGIQPAELQKEMGQEAVALAKKNRRASLPQELLRQFTAEN